MIQTLVEFSTSLVASQIDTQIHQRTKFWGLSKFWHCYDFEITWPTIPPLWSPISIQGCGNPHALCKDHFHARRGADCILVDVGMMADAWWPLPVHKGAVQLHNGGKLAKIWVMSFPSSNI